MIHVARTLAVPAACSIPLDVRKPAPGPPVRCPTLPQSLPPRLTVLRQFQLVWCSRLRTRKVKNSKKSGFHWSTTRSGGDRRYFINDSCKILWQTKDGGFWRTTPATALFVFLPLLNALHPKHIWTSPTGNLKLSGKKNQWMTWEFSL